MPKSPVPEIEIFDLEGNLLGKFQDLVHAKWNGGELPNRESGQYDNLTIAPNPVKVADYHGVLHEMDVYAQIRVRVAGNTSVVFRSRSFPAYSMFLLGSRSENRWLPDRLAE